MKKKGGKSERKSTEEEEEEEEDNNNNKMSLGNQRVRTAEVLPECTLKNSEPQSEYNL